MNMRNTHMNMISDMRHGTGDGDGASRPLSAMSQHASIAAFRLPPACGSLARSLRLLLLLARAPGGGFCIWRAALRSARRPAGEWNLATRAEAAHVWGVHVTM
jgi:hypothetical protein